MRTTIRVPATTANLGPGFDSLGLALDIWNEFEFQFGYGPDHAAGEPRVEIEGHGAARLPADRTNLVLRALWMACEWLEVAPPPVRLRARHRFPIGSGLGSSASAIAAGVLAAQALAGSKAGDFDPLQAAVAIEGHPDNVSAALLGGLTVSYHDGARTVSVPVLVAPGWRTGVVVPAVEVSTAAMRAALPAAVPFADAVYNLGRAALVVRALEQGDEALLCDVMADRLHQPVRLPLIRGAAEALAAAGETGAAAALSGAGPGLIVFGRDEMGVAEAVRRMEQVFAGLGIECWNWRGGVSVGGAEVTVIGE